MMSLPLIGHYQLRFDFNLVLFVFNQRRNLRHQNVQCKSIRYSIAVQSGVNPKSRFVSVVGMGTIGISDNSIQF
jgi:hypothetical protein